MYRTIGLTPARCSALVFFLFTPTLAQASCFGLDPTVCYAPPAPFFVAWGVSQNTSISLASQGPSPLFPQQGEMLGITVPKVSTRDVCEQPGFDVSYPDPITGICFFDHHVPTYIFIGTGTGPALQPTGTAVIQQNGVTVGSVSINSATSNYSFTTPPVNVMGNINFVALFNPSSSAFTSATSNTLTVFSSNCTGLEPALIGGTCTISLPGFNVFPSTGTMYSYCVNGHETSLCGPTGIQTNSCDDGVNSGFVQNPSNGPRCRIGH